MKFNILNSEHFLLTRMFTNYLVALLLETRAFNLLILLMLPLLLLGFKLVTHRFELVTCGLELVSGALELVTSGLKSSLVYLNWQLPTHILYFTFPRISIGLQVFTI